MAGLPKKYAKMGFKKGWRAFKASKTSAIKRRTSTVKRRATGTARKVYRRTRNMRSKKIINNPYARGLAITLVAKAIAPRVGVATPLAKAGLAMYTGDKVLVGASAGEYINLGSMFTGEGAIGAITGAI